MSRFWSDVETHTKCVALFWIVCSRTRQNVTKGTKTNLFGRTDALLFRFNRLSTENWKKKNTQLLFHNIARASEGFAIAVRQIASALEDIPSFRMHRKQSLYSEMFLGVYFTTKHTEGIISAGAGKLIRMPRNNHGAKSLKESTSCIFEYILPCYPKSLIHGHVFWSKINKMTRTLPHNIAHALSVLLLQSQ